MLNFILASIVYMQLADEARTGLVFVSVATTLAYLILGMALTVGVAGIFLFKASRLLRHSVREGFRSVQQRWFWLAGFGGLIWLMLFPVLYAQIVGSLVSGMIQLGVNANAWEFMFVVSALVMLGMFFVSLWAANALRVVVFIWKFAPEEAVKTPPEQPEPVTFPDAQKGSLLENISI
jgi:MFS family permease